MRAIIIAGGESKRLRPLTEHIPKTLLPLQEKMIVEHILDSIRESGIRHVTILTGHGHEHVSRFAEKHNSEYPQTQLDLHFINDYADYGNVIALRAARALFEKEDTIIINSDTIFHPDILKQLLRSDAPYAMAIDDVKTLGEEEMKVLVDEDNTIYRIHKSLDPATAHGEYVGILKFEKGIHVPLADSTENMIAQDPSVYYEDAIERMITDHQIQVKSISTEGLPVIEIDTPEDLEAAHDILNTIRA